jgi:hypothetical protein
MQNSDGLQKKIKNACGVNDTACTMDACTVHAVSITPHAGFSQKLLQKRKCSRKLKKPFLFQPYSNPLFYDIYIVAFVINKNRT